MRRRLQEQFDEMNGRESIAAAESDLVGKRVQPRLGRCQAPGFAFLNKIGQIEDEPACLPGLRLFEQGGWNSDFVGRQVIVCQAGAPYPRDYLPRLVAGCPVFRLSHESGPRESKPNPVRPELGVVDTLAHSDLEVIAKIGIRRLDPRRGRDGNG